MPYREDLPGFMSVKDLKVLEQLAKTVPKNGVIVEVGSFMGRSSWALAKSCDPSVTLFCIDSWPKYHFTSEDFKKMAAYKRGMKFDFATFKENIRDCSNVKIIRACSLEVVWDHCLVDLIFIDGDHESPGIDRDLECWSTRLKPNGILSGHDFSLAFPHVCRAVIKKSEKEGLPFKLFSNSVVWTIEKHFERNRNQGFIPSEENIEEIKAILDI